MLAQEVARCGEDPEGPGLAGLLRGYRAMGSLPKAPLTVASLRGPSAPTFLRGHLWGMVQGMEPATCNCSQPATSLGEPEVAPPIL